MADNHFAATVEALFQGMDHFVTTKTVVGDAVKIGGVTKLVSVKQQDAMTKVLDMVPDFVNKFVAGKPEEPVSREAEQAARDMAAKAEEKTETEPV
mgnify:CR=1 FL=1